eukprot:TRINITY_DN4903_c0_g1_i1.p1 TRINITY_DN4903_c0_g1~~TRINITY_DN4903_c0_g1_i1.p1  ORF type:complete len:409 (-),score=82.03 TRINITY_DN4903_c0_g1_i1:195-1352(-)
MAAAPDASERKRPADDGGCPLANKRHAVAETLVPKELDGLHAYVVNLERRHDRWIRVESMLKKETPWLTFEKFEATDGTKNPIPEAEVFESWNTSCNAHFADYFEWVFDAPGTPLDSKVWKWAADAEAEDEEWRFAEDAEDEFSYIHHAVTFKNDPVRTATLEKKATGEQFKLRLQFAERYLEPGVKMLMSGGERGCAHSHLRLWRVAAARKEHTLVFEDDVQVVFDRTDSELGQMNGNIFTERLALAIKHAPQDFDVIYLGWSGWRGGHNRNGEADSEESESNQFIRKAQFVWTTVAYVISRAGANKLLTVAKMGVDQPVDNFMAWEASQGRLNSFVALDEGDDDGTWAGGIVDQFDFQGDSDIKKSDGGLQGDDAKEFAVVQQ